MTIAIIAALYVYPVKSCAGISLSSVALTATGLAGDRQWMVVDTAGRFLTQREAPRMALIKPTPWNRGLKIHAPDRPEICVQGNSVENPIDVTVWRDRCAAFDEGSPAAEYLSDFLGRTVRLVRFDPAQQRLSSRDWTQDIEALNQFSDGYPILAISNASLDDLNRRLQEPVPMNRFRPNIVLEGLDAYGEDSAHEFHTEDIRLRVVKPCTRCKITTTDQTSGVSTGAEPLQTLRSYRWSPALKGVTFGQNLVTVSGIGAQLFVGQSLGVSWKRQRTS